MRIKRKDLHAWGNRIKNTINPFFFLSLFFPWLDSKTVARAKRNESRCNENGQRFRYIDLNRII